MGKLKPCPFCGSEDVHFDEAWKNKDRPIYWLICENCGMCSRAFGDEDSAKKWWNKRADFYPYWMPFPEPPENEKED